LDEIVLEMRGQFLMNHSAQMIVFTLRNRDLQEPVTPAHDLVAWRWEDARAGIFGRRLAQCMPTVWSAQAPFEQVLSLLINQARVHGSTDANRAIRIRIRSVEVVFPSLVIAVSALQGLCAVNSEATEVAASCVADCASDYISDDSMNQNEMSTTQLRLNAERDASKGVCAICLEDIFPGEATWVLPCSHHFHAGCLCRWLHAGDSCPICRQPLVGATLCHISSK